MPARFDRAPSEAGPPLSVATAAEGTGDREIVFEPIELPRTHRLSGVTIAALAAVAGVAAIALGMWAFVSSVRAQDDAEIVRSAPIDGAARALSLLSRRSSERIPLAGTKGSVVLGVGTRGRGVLVLDGLAIAPAGRSYQAWVVDPGKRPVEHVSAAVFSGVETVVPLAQRVPRGWVVGLTVEQEGGVQAPTQRLRFAGRRPADPVG